LNASQRSRAPEPTAGGARPRLQVFVIAYCAERTVDWVLDRIPRTLSDRYDLNVLFLDDASVDGTFERARAYARKHPELPIEVRRNARNLGYGGAQKVGYAIAIERGVDMVAMVHGDGQYAPEMLPTLVEPVRRGEADVVFGSRMLTPGGALRGGMPRYKYVGNRVLTVVQNALLGTRFSELHTGYRIYAVPMLAQLALDRLSDDFDFDTEIVLQLLGRRARIEERAIPTFYGSEISRVDGLRYARQVVTATALLWLHRAGIRRDRRFETTEAFGSRRR